MELSSLPYLGAWRFAQQLTEPKCQEKTTINQISGTKTSTTKTTIAKTLAFAAALLSSSAVFANTDVPFNVTASSPSFTLTGGSLGGTGCNITSGLHRYDTVTFRVNGSGSHNVSTLSLTGMGGIILLRCIMAYLIPNHRRQMLSVVMMMATLQVIDFGPNLVPI
jgi:hypothetical protein